MHTSFSMLPLPTSDRQPAIAPPSLLPAITVRDLHHRYARTVALNGIELTVQRGELFGLMGPDGAGKTTTFHILGGVLTATAGDVQVLGHEPRAARSLMGYLTQQFSLYLDLSVDENLRYAAGLRQVPADSLAQRRHHYLHLMDLDRFGDRLAGQLSGGMKQKLALCCALISQPQVLLLDEPTTGVDPVSRREFRDVLAELAATGMTIIVATPYLDEAERCDRVALMYGGQIHQIGTPVELRASLCWHRLELHTPELEAAERILTTSHAQDIADVQTFGDRLDVLVPHLQRGEAQLRQILQAHQVPVAAIVATEPTLENVFVARLRQQSPAAPLLPFPRARGGNRQSSKTWDRETPGRETQANIAISARNLSRMFGTFSAVKNVNLHVRYGEIFGLLGANGAGKTTTIKMLCGLLAATAGDLAIGGETINLRSAELRRRIGYMSQKFTLYDDLTIVQNLEFYSGVYGVPAKLRAEKIEWVLVTCGLVGQETMIAGQLPGGWKQRVALGASVLHEPDILFLDEPTSGVDPLARRQFWKIINDFARHGTAILVTTHYLEEAEQCHRLSFMVAGETVAAGSPSQLKAAQPGQLLEVRVDRPQIAANLLKCHFDSWRVSIFADHLHLVLDDPERELAKVRSLLAPDYLRSLRPIPFSLEDAFIGIVQRSRATA